MNIFFTFSSILYNFVVLVITIILIPLIVKLLVAVSEKDAIKEKLLKALSLIIIVIAFGYLVVQFVVSFDAIFRRIIALLIK